MTNLALISETALLVLFAYLLGCVLGYGIRMALHAGRGTRRVAELVVTAAPTPELPKPRSSAARLAARVDDAPPSPSVAAPSAAGHDTASASASRPATLAGPRAGTPDNLKQIKGIGPKIEASLYAMGIFHVHQIAAWNKANINWVDAQLAFKGRIRRERWVEQALTLTAANEGAPRRLSGRA
ncbi:hypothetical protein JI749_13700 [Devosia oryziradicis]|uniref:NADH-quinone oxidoreductase subunit E n=1 Tax=Devosia oryziradicis TaxID=2801335 RepID=A0ABX7BTZ9_9HYPH|nr:hypothetical protein [Devosia oryziradicis]QQR35401.1 hypothetical protein JI749_13700 [Devosia oryziradicis]